MFGRARVSAREMRRIRAKVRNLTSLLATDGPIYEMPGRAWMCDMQNRIIYWRPLDPLSGEQMEDDELLCNVVHEAGHIIYTGGASCPVGYHPAAWASFWNAPEDIRIERYLSRDKPGFADMIKLSNRRALKWWQAEAYRFAKAPALMTVGFNWMLLEGADEDDRINMFGSLGAQEFALRTWEAVVDRLCNAASTEQMCKGLAPIFIELVSARVERREPEFDNIDWGDVDFEEAGQEELEEHPTRSPFPQSPLAERLQELKAAHQNGTEKSGIMILGSEMTFGMILTLMQSQADDPSFESFFANLLSGEKAAEQDGVRIALYSTGSQPGTAGGPADKSSPNVWRDAVTANRQDINMLSRKLQSTLRSNAMDDWEPGHERGQLDISVAYKSLTGYNKIFRELNSPDGLDYAFGILIDVSGSQYERSNELLAGGVILCEALERAGIPFFLVPWASYPGRVKPMLAPLSEYAGNIAHALRNPDGGTYEAPALCIAEDQFRKVPRASEKVLITITDGFTSMPDESLELIEILRDEVHVRDIGIGLGCAAPAHYEHQLDVYDARTLKTILPKFINERVKKR